MLTVPDYIVSCKWLREHLNEDNLVILDATIPKVAAKNAKESLSNDVIPGAKFFDIKKDFSDLNAPFPNTMIAPESFQKGVRNLGISKNTCVIIYDTHGIYSSPRAWWMFRSMGINNVAVLDGGLPEWLATGFQTFNDYDAARKKGDFMSIPVSDKFVDYKQVRKLIDDKNVLIVDARSNGRFHGKEPEPREGVRSGHIPSSINIPYSSLLNEHKFKPKKELKSIFNNISKNKEVLVTSCGTGITACVLALGATLASYETISVYDGSWTEWGSLLDLPIEK